MKVHRISNVGMTMAAVLATLISSTAHPEEDPGKHGQTSSETGGTAAIEQPESSSGEKSAFSGLKAHIRRKRGEIDVKIDIGGAGAEAANRENMKKGQISQQGGSIDGKSGKRKENNKNGEKGNSALGMFAETFKEIFKDEVKKAMARRNAEEKSDKMFEKTTEITKKAFIDTLDRMKEIVASHEDLAPDLFRDLDENLPCLGPSDPMCSDN